jgi:hypothetical protein
MKGPTSPGHGREVDPREVFEDVVPHDEGKF